MGNFNVVRNPKEKKQARLTLIFLFGLTLGLIFVAILYREIPDFWQKLNTSATVVSKQFSSFSPTPTPIPAMETEKEAIKRIIKPLRGKYGVYFLDLETGEHFEINGRESFTAASLIKLPVMLTLYRETERGGLRLETVYRLRAEDKRGGAGSLQYKPAGFEVDFRRLAELMGQQSDNTAFQIVSTALGREKIQELINDLGMKNTSFTDSFTTPQDIAVFFERLYRGKIISDQSRDEIFAFLTKTIWEDRIPAGLPKNIRSVHKVGTETKVVSDAGIIFTQKPYILAILSEGVNEVEAQKALPEISRKVYELHEVGN